jgi:multidrug efflux pump subunit AcrA (membrane-fusion protein)
MKEKDFVGISLFDISRYDNEVQAIMTKPPSWITRWGLLVISLAIFSIIGTSYFLRYPDIVKASVILNSYSPPVKIIANQSGRIKLFVKDGDSVRKGHALGYIATTTSYEEVVKYTKYSDTIKNIIQKGLFENIYLNATINMGDLQDSYIALMTHIGNYISHNKEKRLVKNMKNFAEEQSLYNSIAKKIENQAELYKEQNDLAKKRFQRDSLLYTQKVISKQEFENSKNTYLLPSASSIESNQQSLKNNELRMSELINQKSELIIQEERYKNDLKNNIILSFNELKKRLDLWKLQYVLEAPIDGKVTLFEIRNSEDYVLAGKEILDITQARSHVVGICTLPVQNSAKVKVGQNVNIEFMNYPAREYGYIVGKINSISPVPKDGNYFVVIYIPDEPLTDQRKKIDYKELMSGVANIRTEDMRLIERFIYRFREAIQR